MTARCEKSVIEPGSVLIVNIVARTRAGQRISIERYVPCKELHRKLVRNCDRDLNVLFLIDGLHELYEARSRRERDNLQQTSEGAK